jgi:hypothetical protein
MVVRDVTANVVSQPIFSASVVVAVSAVAASAVAAASFTVRIIAWSYINQFFPGLRRWNGESSIAQNNNAG